MSIFAESKWEADSVGDKLSTELFLRKKKKIKSKKETKKDRTVSKSTRKNDDSSKIIVAPTVVGRKPRPEKKKNKIKGKREESNDRPVSKSTQKNDDNSGKNIVTRTEIAAKLRLEKKRNRSASNRRTDPESSENKSKKIKLPGQERRKMESGKDSNNEPEAEVHKETKSSRRRKKRKLKKMEKNGEIVHNDNDDAKREIPATPNVAEKRNGKIKSNESLRDRMMGQLRASRFRFLNETLYDNTSSESNEYFKQDPDAFAAYHAGYRHQVERWPLNPLDVMITSIKKMSKDLVVADFGCGEARLAESVPQTVHSFDLVAVNDKVKACDMARTPLLTNGVNVVVFCLSLMGANLGDYFLEANRVLAKDGILKIAEVESRFENVQQFIRLLADYGFVETWKDLSHNLFYFMDFKKTRHLDRRNNKFPEIVLKSCLYKKR